MCYIVSGSLDLKSSAAKGETSISPREETVILDCLCKKLANKLYLLKYFLPCRETVNIWGVSIKLQCWKRSPRTMIKTSKLLNCKAWRKHEDKEGLTQLTVTETALRGLLETIEVSDIKKHRFSSTELENYAPGKFRVGRVTEASWGGLEKFCFDELSFTEHRPVKDCWKIKWKKTISKGIHHYLLHYVCCKGNLGYF